MPQHRQIDILPFTPEQMFNIVADIEKYPEFLPWCQAARVEKSDGGAIAELLIAYKAFRESYTSEVTFEPYQRIEVKAIKGSFKYLINEWKFTPHKDGVEVEFFLDFKFRSKILDMVMSKFFHKAVQRMTKEFIKRAEELYG